MNLAPHGTERRYQQERKMREVPCDECLAGHRKYVAEGRRKRLAEGRVRHGEPAGYYDGCRCRPCTDAHTEDAYVRRAPERREREKFLDDIARRMWAAGWNG